MTLCLAKALELPSDSVKLIDITNPHLGLDWRGVLAFFFNLSRLKRFHKLAPRMVPTAYTDNTVKRADSWLRA